MIDICAECFIFNFHTSYIMNISLLKEKFNEINNNWNTLDNTMKCNELYDERNTMKCNELYDERNTMKCNIISHLKDIEEILDVLNDKLCILNDKIESESDIKISKYSLERINNNIIIKNLMKPYLPFMMLDLVNNAHNIT